MKSKIYTLIMLSGLLSREIIDAEDIRDQSDEYSTDSESESNNESEYTDEYSTDSESSTSNLNRSIKNNPLTYQLTVNFSRADEIKNLLDNNNENKLTLEKLKNCTVAETISVIHDKQKWFVDPSSPHMESLKILLESINKKFENKIASVEEFGTKILNNIFLTDNNSNYLFDLIKEDESFYEVLKEALELLSYVFLDSVSTWQHLFMSFARDKNEVGDTFAHVLAKYDVNLFKFYFDLIMNAKLLDLSWARSLICAEGHSNSTLLMVFCQFLAKLGDQCFKYGSNDFYCSFVNDLIDAGIDPNEKDKNGKTAREYLKGVINLDYEDESEDESNEENSTNDPDYEDESNEENTTKNDDKKQSLSLRIKQNFANLKKKTKERNEKTKKQMKNIGEKIKKFFNISKNSYEVEFEEPY